MKTLLTICLFILSQPVIAQIDYSIRINFKLIAPSRFITLAFETDQRTETIAYPSNNSIELKGIINKAGTVSIKTDSSAPIRIWVDNTPISFDCEEQRSGGRYNRLVISNLVASDDTKLLNDLVVPRTSSSMLSSNLTEDQLDSARKANIYHDAYHRVDSLLRTRPASPIITYYISYYRNALGPNAVKYFYNQLSDSQKNSDEGLSLSGYLDRTYIMTLGNLVSDFTLTSDRKDPVSLYSIKSKYILLDFWASWCLPCRNENPKLKAVYSQFNSKGLEIIGISLDSDREAWKKAIKADNLPWVHVSDLRGWENGLARKYSINSIPFSVLLNDKFEIVDVPFDASSLRKMLQRLLP